MRTMRTCVVIKHWLVTHDPLEGVFSKLPRDRVVDVASSSDSMTRYDEAAQAVLHALEGLNERLICDAAKGCRA